MDDLGQLVIVEHGEGQDQLTGVGRSSGERVTLRTDHRAEGGDELFPDRVKGRIGDLSKQLGEVVEEQARALGQHCDGAVGAHRAQRLSTGPGHRSQQDPQFFLGVAEGLLTSGHRCCGVHDVLPLGQRTQVDQASMQPVLVGILSSQRRLDLVVADDAAVLGVDQEHPTWLQPALADHSARLEVQDSGLRRKDYQAVISDPVAPRAQTVAVQNRANDGAVGEGDAGRTVPGLHKGGVVLIERLARRVHLCVVLPRLGDHHQDGVRQRTTAQM